MTQRKRMLRAARRKVAQYWSLIDRTLKEHSPERFMVALAMWEGANSVYRRLSKSKR